MRGSHPGLERRYLNGTRSTFVEWIAKKGAKVPLHPHENEQITWITKGSCEVYSQENNFNVMAGEIMIAGAGARKRHRHGPLGDARAGKSSGLRAPQPTS